MKSVVTTEAGVWKKNIAGKYWLLSTFTRNSETAGMERAHLTVAAYHLLYPQMLPTPNADLAKLTLDHASSLDPYSSWCVNDLRAIRGEPSWWWS